MKLRLTKPTARILLLLLCALPVLKNALAQNHPIAAPQRSGITRFVNTKGDLFGLQKTFIQNVGQYDELVKHHGSAKVLYGYEGFGPLVAFTTEGIVHLQKEWTQPKQEEEREEERRKKNPGEV